MKGVVRLPSVKSVMSMETGDTIVFKNEERKWTITRNT